MAAPWRTDEQAFGREGRADHGTGGGQGRAAALKFAEEGALIVGCDLFEEGNLETVAAVQAAGQHDRDGSG